MIDVIRLGWVMSSLMLALALASPAQSTTESFHVTLDGAKREWTVVRPKDATKGPIVFAFHGHGGNIRNAMRSFDMTPHWPEVTMVYMQGIPTATPNDPEGKRNGWQTRAGILGDRDLKFFDHVYAKLGATPKRTGVMGHSNGGRFTYLLWAERGSKFAAYAPSGSPATGLNLKAAPVFHLMGETDPIVSPANQKATITNLKSMNGAKGDGEKVSQYTQRWSGAAGNEVWTHVHPGGHRFPTAQLKEIADFFRGHLD